jgi:hypothetical protein
MDREPATEAVHRSEPEKSVRRQRASKNIIWGGILLLANLVMMPALDPQAHTPGTVSGAGDHSEAGTIKLSRSSAEKYSHSTISKNRTCPPGQRKLITGSSSADTRDRILGISIGFFDPLSSLQGKFGQETLDVGRWRDRERIVKTLEHPYSPGRWGSSSDSLTIAVSRSKGPSAVLSERRRPI